MSRLVSSRRTRFAIGPMSAWIAIEPPVQARSVLCRDATVVLGLCLAAQQTPVFSADVPLAKRAHAILTEKCSRCHGEAKQESGLDLRSRETILKGGESGPAIVPGKPNDSRIFQRVRDGEMPPKKSDRLSTREINTLREWIAAGGRGGAR